MKVGMYTLDWRIMSFPTVLQWTIITKGCLLQQTFVSTNHSTLGRPSYRPSENLLSWWSSFKEKRLLCSANSGKEVEGTIKCFWWRLSRKSHIPLPGYLYYTTYKKHGQLFILTCPAHPLPGCMQGLKFLYFLDSDYTEQDVIRLKYHTNSELSLLENLNKMI